MFLIPRDNEIVNSDYAYTSIWPMCVCVHIVNFYLASMLICMVYCVDVSLYMHAQRELWRCWYFFFACMHVHIYFGRIVGMCIHCARQHKCLIDNYPATTKANSNILIPFSIWFFHRVAAFKARTFPLFLLPVRKLLLSSVRPFALYSLSHHFTLAHIFFFEI